MPVEGPVWRTFTVNVNVAYWARGARSEMWNTVHRGGDVCPMHQRSPEADRGVVRMNSDMDIQRRALLSLAMAFPRQCPLPA